MFKITHYWGGRQSGKSMQSIHITRSLAQQGKKVCLIVKHFYDIAHVIANSDITVTTLDKLMEDIRGKKIDAFIFDDVFFNKQIYEADEIARAFEQYIYTVSILQGSYPDAEIYVFNILPSFNTDN